MGWSMDSWEWAKSVVGEVRHGVGVGPGTDGIDFSDANRPTPIFSCRVFQTISNINNPNTIHI